MDSLEITAPGSFGIVDSPRPALGSHDVRLSVERVGLCATDVHIVHGHFPKAEFPLIPGHELCGRVTEIGAEVDSVAVGDLVAIDPAQPCGQCVMCSRGRTNLCSSRRAHGINMSGGMSAEMVGHETSCYRVHSDVDPSIAVLTEPLACVIHGFSRVGNIEGLSVLVMGAGTIGLLAAEYGSSQRAATVDVAEINPNRQAVATEHGFTLVNLDEASASERGWDIVVDATGVAVAIERGLRLVSAGGTFLQLGVADPDDTVALSPYAVFSKELTIVGSLTTVGTFVEAVALIDSGALNLKGITGPASSLSDFGQLVENFSTQAHLKATIDPRISQN